MHILFSLIFAVVVLKYAESVRVQLSTGTIEGRTLTATYSPFGNQSSIVFFGIPYVEPPLGDLRFRKPRPPVPWNGILETKEYKPACMSNVTKTYKNGGTGPISEDCLYANIFTNEYCMTSQNCSVMLAIHGGGFLFESASAFDPQILINNFVGQGRNIVVVSINYRLGLWGFGQFAGDQGDRNMGLYDILAGVKWVRNEIHLFGGRKDRITLTGHSAGAGLIVAFTNSPLTKGLIHQQIIMSGPLSNVSKKSNFKAFTKVAQIVGCVPEKAGFRELENMEIERAYQCLRSKPAQELLDAELWIVQNSTYFFGAPFVDGEFIVDYPDVIIGQKKVTPINTLIGTTTAELRDTIYLISPENAPKKDVLLRLICEHIGYEIYSNPEKFVEKCVKYYGNDTKAQYLSDDMEFYSRAVSVADAHVSLDTKVFLYSYAYSGAGAAFNKYLEVPSPHHSEDLIYIFGTHRGVMAPKDYVIEHIYSGIFANFINFGDPSPSEEQPWEQYSPEKREHFLIDFDEEFRMPGMRQDYYVEASRFWGSVGSKSFAERFSPSLDTFIITHLATPYDTHLRNITTDQDKVIEPVEELYQERLVFLEELKRERAVEKKKTRKMVHLKDLEVKNDGEINILLLIFGCTLVGGILYVTISHFCLHHRSREGYQLLK